MDLGPDWLLQLSSVSFFHFFVCILKKKLREETTVPTANPHS
jgi:hypothetical protein